MTHLLRRSTLALLAGCSDGEDPGYTWGGYDPDSTLCGRISTDYCDDDDLPGEVSIYTIAPGMEGWVCASYWGDSGLVEPPPDWRGELVAEPEVEEEGHFQAAIPAGVYGVTASWGGCGVCQEVTIADGACEEVEVIAERFEQNDAPNVYLYPERPQWVRVAVAEPDRITASDPEYPQAGWRTWARPDGSLRTSEGERGYLFYEYLVASDSLQRGEGWCVAGGSAVASLESALAVMGFNEREIADFGEYWDEAFPDAAAVTVYPQLEGLPPLLVDPRPDTLLRAWFLVEDGCAAAVEPAIEPVERRGFVAAEWGLMVGRGLERMEPLLVR